MDDRYYPEIPDWCTLHNAKLIEEKPNHNTLTEEEHKEAFKKILKRTIEDNKDLLKGLEKL